MPFQSAAKALALEAKRKKRLDDYVQKRLNEQQCSRLRSLRAGVSRPLPGAGGNLAYGQNLDMSDWKLSPDLGCAQRRHAQDVAFR